jgi:hypothetical protein
MDMACFGLIPRFWVKEKGFKVRSVFNIFFNYTVRIAASQVTAKQSRGRLKVSFSFIKFSYYIFSAVKVLIHK